MQEIQQKHVFEIQELKDSKDQLMKISKSEKPKMWPVKIR